VKSRQAVSVIETAYEVELASQQWLERLAAAGAEALESTQGAMALRYDASSRDWVHAGVPALWGLPPEFARDFFNQSDLPREFAIALARVAMTVRFGSTRAAFAQIGISRLMDPVFDRYRIDDMIAINGLEPSGRGCLLFVAARKRTYAPRTVELWNRLAAHISAGNRLRTTLEELEVPASTSRAEAILTPNGTVEHASGPAQPRSARKSLRDALVRIDAARSGRHDLQRSVDLWRGLVAGRWSLVEHFERDGRRYYLAHKNDPELAADRGLTLREKQVLGYAELGYSNKLIAYSLGLSSSAISTLLARARRKAGIT
jgi:DNA-binding CsgD family transcriptional regulator